MQARSGLTRSERAFSFLAGRARPAYGGNVSGVVRYIAYEEGRDALIASFGGNGTPTPGEARRLDAEWGLSAKKPT
jgi:hypothetical protein